MKKPTTDIKDALRINNLFSRISEDDKNMALAYLSALGDKAIADRAKSQEAAKASRAV